MKIRNLLRRSRGKTYVWQSEKNAKWYWRHVSRNGKTDNASEQGYNTRKYAREKARNAYSGAKIIVLDNEGDLP